MDNNLIGIPEVAQQMEYSSKHIIKAKGGDQNQKN
jgi:hypothetical protein